MRATFPSLSLFSNVYNNTAPLDSTSKNLQTNGNNNDNDIMWTVHSNRTHYLPIVCTRGRRYGKGGLLVL